VFDGGFYCTLCLMWVLGVVALWVFLSFLCGLLGVLLYCGGSFVSWVFFVLWGVSFASWVFDGVYYCILGLIGCCEFVIPCGFFWVSMWVS